MADNLKHVLFVLPNLNAGGAERVTLNFIRQLDPKELKIYLVVLDATSDLELLVPSHVTLIDLKTKKASRSLLALCKHIRRIKPDCVYASHSRLVFLLAVISKFSHSFRFLARVPSMPSLEREQNYTSLKMARLYTWAYRSSDVILAQTEAMKDDVVEEYGIDPEKVAVVHNPLDTSLIDELISAPNPFSNKGPNIVASGRLSREKGFDVLLNALPIVLGLFPQASLHIIGREAAQLSELKLLVHDLGIEQSVKFCGFQSNPYAYYANSDLFVLSSRREGFPNALLENYYLCTPLVSTQCVPIVRELVKPRFNGELAPVESVDELAAAIVRVLTNIKRGSFANEQYEGGSIYELLVGAV